MIWRLLASDKFFPCANAVLGILAAARYAMTGSAGKGLYWLLGSLLTLAVTFVMK